LRTDAVDWLRCLSAAVWHAGMLPGWLVGTVVARDVVLTAGAFVHRAAVQRWRWRGWRRFFQLAGPGAAPLMQPLMVSKVRPPNHLTLLTS
jgi:hypothetical protein